METEAKVPEDESAKNFTLIESATSAEREQIKFPQKNGNDLIPKFPLVEETSQENSGKTGEISVTGPQEIYQYSRKVSAESEKHAEQQHEGNITKVLKESNAELMEMEIISKSSVTEDEDLSTLPNIASIHVERVDESILDEIQKEAKSSMTDKREQQESERDLAEKEEFPEAFGLHEVTGKSCTENVKKDEPLLEEQSLETKVIKNPNLEETTEISSSNDTEEHEKVWESHHGETINFNYGGKLIKEEAKEMGEENNMQLLKTASEIVLENEAPILSTSAFAKGETDDEIFQKQALNEEESAAKENESCGPESKLEQATKAVEILPMFKEAIDPPEAVSNFGGHNEEQTDHLSEAQTSQSATTEHIIPEDFIKTERSTKSSYNIEESWKISDSHTVGNSEIKESLLEETVYIKEPKDVELQKSETESVPEDKGQSAILATVSHAEEEKIHNEVESTVEDTTDEQTSETNFEKKRNEGSDSCEVTEENEKIEESQPEAQSQETIIMEYQNLGISTEINPSIDKEVLEMAPTSLTEEKANEIKEATDMQLTESATEITGVSDNEAQSALAKSINVIGEKVDEILQEQTLKEEESAAINSDNSMPENQLKQTDKYVEKIGLSETIGNVAALNEELDDNYSDSSALESVIKNDTLSEGLVTMESHSSTKSSYDVEELKKIPEPHFVEISEDIDLKNTALEEAIYINELPNSDREKVVGVATTEEIREEEIHMKLESAVTDTKEEQKSENDFEKKNEVSEVINQSADNIFVETKSKGLNQEITVINHQNLVETTKTGNDTQEFEIIVPSHTGVKTETEDDGKFIEEQEKDMEEATIAQLLKTATQMTGVTGDEAPLTLLSSAIIRGETAQEIFPEVCKAENEQEQMAKKDELNQAVIAMGKVNEENEEHCDPQTEVTTLESVITKDTISEGLAEKEISTNSSYDLEQKKIPEHTAENLDITNSDKIPPEEAIYVNEATEVDLRNSEMESALEDEALSILPSTASVEVETVEESIQEEIHKEGESTVTDAKDSKEGERPENYFEENKNFLEALELQETTTENKKKDDPQLEVLSQQIKDIKLPNLEGETTETKPCNDSETNEDISVSPTKDKLEIYEGENHTQQEAKVMEEATNMQLSVTTIESFDDEGPSILPTLSIVKGQTVEETFLLQILNDERPESTDTTGCCMPENNLEQTEKVVEDFDTHKTMGKVGAKSEEHADDKSQPSESENAITKNTNSEEIMTTEDITKATNDIDEQENISRSHSVENSEIKDSSEILPEQTISMKEAAVDSSKFETESLHENKALSTLPTVESIGVETVMKSIKEETHTEGESTVANTKVGQIPEDDFEEKKKVPENFELHKPKRNISQSEVPSLQAVALKPQDLGDATVTNRCNDSEENELTVSHTSEKLEIMDGGKFILEGEKEKEEAIQTQLQESTKEITGDDEAPSTFPTEAIAKGEVVDKVFQEQTFPEEEPTAIDKDGSSGLENELEETAKLVEAIDLTETKGKVGAENEEQADNQSKILTLETQTAKHSNSEGTVTMEGNTASYEVEQEKIPDSHSRDNLESKDGVKTLEEHAIYNKEAAYPELPKSETESLPEDQAMSTFSTTISVGVETVDGSIQEEIHREEESEITETKFGQRPESDFEEEKKVPEDFDLHKTDNTCVETKMTYEMQSLKTTATEHLNSEAYTREITTSNDTREHEEVLVSHTSEKLEIKDKGKFILEEGKGKDEGIEIQLEEYAKEMTGVTDDEVSTTLPTSAMVKDETANETIQELTFKKEDSGVVDTYRSFKQENEHNETAKVVEELDIPKSIGKVGEEKAQYADYKSEFPILKDLITQHTNLNEIVKVEGSTKTRNEVDEQEIIPEDKALSTLHTTASFSVETVEENNQGIQKEAESSGTDTEEMQTPQNHFDEKEKVPEAFDMHEETVNICVETEKKDEPQFEGQSLETRAAEHPALHIDEELAIKDTEKFIVEEPKEMEVSTGMQLQESSKESVLGDEASLTLPTSAVAKGVIVEEVIQQRTLYEEKSLAKDIDGNSRPENELEQTPEVHEGNDLPETTSQLHSETLASEITIKGDTISDGLVTTEISTESSCDGEYLGKIPHSLKSSEMMDSGKSLLEEATAVDLQKSETEIRSEDKTMSILPCTTSAGVDIVEESIHEEAESAATDTEAGQSQKNYLVDKEEDFEAFDLQKSTVENESHLEVKSQETMVIVHPNLEGENREAKLGCDTDDLKQLPVSLTEENSEIMDKWRFVQAGTTKAMEEATVIQLLDSTKESVTDDEASSTLPALEIVKAGVVKENVHEETFKQVEAATIDYDPSYIPDNELENEASDLPKIMGKIGAQNEEYMSKHTILERLETKEISPVSNYDGEELEKILKSHPVDNSQIKGAEKNEPEEATCINKTTYVELKSESESVPEDQTLSTFLTTASVETKTSKETIQAEIPQQMESAVPETKEGQQPEIDSDKRTKISEESHLHEATLDNKKIDELHFKEQSQETIVIDNSNLEADIAETKPYNDTEESEQIRASNTKENLVPKDEEKIIHEEAKVAEETNVMQLPESAEGSIPDDKASSTLPTSAIIKGEKVEDIFQEQTLKEEKSAAIDNDGSCRPENEVEQSDKVIEVIDLPEITGKGGDGNKEPTDYQSEVCTLETAIEEHIISEGLETTEIIRESSYDVEQLENIPESHNVDNSKILDGQKTMAEGAIYIKEATNLETQNKENISEPEENALSTLSTIATVGVETTEESIQDEIDKDAKPAVTTTEEGQRSEDDFDEKKEVQKVDIQEETPENERMHEHQSEVQFLETKTVLEHLVLGGDAAKTVKIYDTKELEQVPTSHTEKKFENKDGENFIDEKAIDVEESIDVQFPESKKESVPDDKAHSTLPTSSIVKGEMAEEFFQDQTPQIEKSASIDNDRSSRPENEFEQTEKVVQAIDPTETMGMVTAENIEHPDHQSRALSSDTSISEQTIAEGLDAIETSKESSHNVKELEQKPESHSTASVRVESIEQSIQENIPTEVELALANTEQMWRQENDLKEKKTVVEDIDPFEVAAEYVKKDEPQSEAQSSATMVIKHPNIGGTTETSLCNDIEDLQHVLVSDDTQNSEIKEGGKYTQEESEKIEDATGVADDESLSTLAKYEIHKCETVDESVQEQTFREETQAAIHNQWSCIPENVLEQTVTVVKEINLSETKIKVGEENDKDGSDQFQAPALETVITKHAISEELETMQIHTESSYNVEELENIPESHYAENSKIKDGGKTMPIEVIDINEATDAESAKSKTENMPEGKVLLTLPTTALVGVETIEESIHEEIHDEAELTVTDINESRRTEYDFEEKKTIHKAFDVHKATAENEEKGEPQIEVQSLETIAINHATLEGDTTETKPSGDTEEQEQGPVSYTAEKSEIQDVGKSILEEEKEKDETNDKQLDESSKESIPGDKAPSMLPTSEILKNEMPEEVFQEITIEEEESAATDNGSNRPENELEQTTKVVETIDLPKTMGKVSIENKEQANDHSKSPTTSAGLMQMTSSTEASYEVDALEKIPESSEELVEMATGTEKGYEVEALEEIPESSEGLVKISSSTESSYEVDAMEKITESQSVNNSEINGCVETLKEETTNAQLPKCETESMLEDKSLSTLLTTETVRVEMEDKNTQTNIQKVTELAVIETNEEHRPEKDLEEKNTRQAFDVNGVTRNTCAESRKKDEPQSEVQSQNTIIVKHPNMEGTISETDPNYYTKELDTVPSSSSTEILNMKEGGKFIQQEVKENKEATGVPEALPTLPRSAIVKGETVCEIFEDQILKEEESAVIDDKISCRPENQIEQTAEVVEAIDLIETVDKVSAQNKEHTDIESEALTLENVVSKNTISAGMLTTESIINSSYDEKKLEKLPQSHTSGISEIKDDVGFPHEEATYVKEATNVELHKSEEESVPKDKALSTTITISDRVKTVEEGIKQEIHKEPESAVTDDKEEKRQENYFEEKEKVSEAFNLRENKGNTFVEHEMNEEIQSEEHCVETMLISPNKSTAEPERFSASYTREKLEMEEEARDMQLSISKIELAAKLDAYEQIDMRESTMMHKSELPAERISIPEPPYPDHEVYDLIKEQLPQTKDMGYNIQDQISEYDDHIQGQIPLCEDQLKPEPQMEAEHHLNVPLSAKETSMVGFITKGVHDGVDRAGAIENIQDEQTIDSGNSLEEAQISSTTEETVNQVKDEITKNLEAKDPDDDDDAQKAKTNLGTENDPIEKEEAADRETDEVIESPKEDEGGNEFVKISPSSSGSTVMIEASRDTEVKATPHKKSHGILSGVGSKVKHSISKVKKAITGKSSNPKTQSPK